MIDDKTKYRIVGLVVIIALFTIVTPILIKNSKRHLGDHKYTQKHHIPPEPFAPKIAMSKNVEFKVRPVANVALEQPVAGSTMAMPVSLIVPIPSLVTATTTVAIIHPITQMQLHHQQRPSRKIVKNKPRSSSVTTYMVQVASFSNYLNAQTLAAKLKANGYQVHFKTITKSKEKLILVLVGSVTNFSQAQSLQNKLATEVKLKGVVVKNRVG